MKKLVFLLTISSLVSLSAIAETNPLSKPLPPGNEVLPPAPVPGSYEWFTDSVKHRECEAIRKTYRKVTKEDSILLKAIGVTKAVGVTDRVDSLIAIKREAYESWLKTYGLDPAINAPLGDATLFPKLEALRLICTNMKSYHTDLWRDRARPYNYYGDWYKTKKYKVNKDDKTTYPSGHGYFAGLFELAMAYVDPTHIAAIKKNSDTFQYQRLILGAHWERDLWAGRQLGAIAFDIAMTDPNFVTIINAAKEELAEYRKTRPAPAADLVIKIEEDTVPGQVYDIARDNVNNAIAVLKKNCDMTPTLKMDIQINRTFFCDTYYNSLCLPFSISADEWSSANNPLAAGTLKRFVSAVVDKDELIITLEEANSIEAGKPYLISFPSGSDIKNPVFKQVRVTTTQSDTLKDEKATCNGTFAPYQLPVKGEDSPYLLLGYTGSTFGLFWPKEDDSYLKGFRAYFEANLSASSPVRHGMKAVLADHKVPTDITTIVWKEGDIVKRVENGNVVIIKDGTKYNMNGQIIR